MVCLSNARRNFSTLVLLKLVFFRLNFVSKLCVYLLFNMEFHNKVTQQAAWDELVHKLSSWKNLTFAYLKSIKDAEPYSDELFNAMKSTSNNFFLSYTVIGNGN